MGQVRPRKTHFNVGGVDLIFLRTVISGFLTHTLPPSLLPSFWLLFLSKVKHKTIYPPSLSFSKEHPCTHTSNNQTPRRSQWLQGWAGLECGWTPYCTLGWNSLFFFTRKLDLYQEPLIWKGNSGLGRTELVWQSGEALSIGLPTLWACVSTHSKTRLACLILALTALKRDP